MRNRYVVFRRLLAESVFRNYFRARRKLSSPAGKNRLIGNVDRVRYRIITGWAYDTEEPDQPVFLRCQVNGVEIGIQIADRYRTDVTAKGHPTGLGGFEFAVPDEIEAVESISIRFLENGSEVPLRSENLLTDKSNRALPPEWRSGNRFRLPSVFLIGGSKCGTSSLYTYLEQHPALCMSKPKEPMYFEAEFDRGTAYYFNRYFAHWKGQEFVVDARVGHLYLPYIPKRLFEYNPDARLLVLLRNPAERAVSAWWHWYSRGLETLSLREAIATDLERIEAGYRLNRPKEQALFERTSSESRRGMFRTYVDAGYFYEQLCRYLEVFPRKQVHVILLDDLARDPKATVLEVLDFLGVDRGAADHFLYPIINRSDPDIRNHFDAATLSTLVEHYRPHNEKLEQLIGRPLRHWDQPFNQLAGRGLF